MWDAQEVFKCETSKCLGGKWERDWSFGGHSELIVSNFFFFSFFN